jgi:RNA-directed DNA polymerase
MKLKYRIARIPKGNGRFREIYIASNGDSLRLRSLLPELNEILLNNDKYKVNYAFQKGKNCALNALQHMGYRYTLSMDLENFFDSVSPKHVTKIIPNRIIKQCFIDGNPKQGLPTSPLISTIALLRTDEKIVEQLAKLNISAVYTRYADDLIFSFNDSKDTRKIQFVVQKIIERYGFKINNHKTQLQDSNNGRIIITGIAVDEMGLHPTRHTKKKMRAASHQKNHESMRGLSEWSKCKLPNDF